MRNQINGMIREIENEKVFCLYEISNQFDHHHKIILEQPIQMGEIKNLKHDLYRIIENIALFEECQHENDGNQYISGQTNGLVEYLKQKCLKCGEFYR